MSKADDLYAKVNQENKAIQCCSDIEKLVIKRLEDAVGRFDWHKSEDGKLINEIMRLLRLRY